MRGFGGFDENCNSVQTFKDEHEAAAAVEQTPKVNPLEIKKFQPIIQYTTLATFSWDQDYDKVKVRNVVLIC